VIWRRGSVHLGLASANATVPPAAWSRGSGGPRAPSQSRSSREEEEGTATPVTSVSA
jgi:hypothetical protein